MNNCIWQYWYFLKKFYLYFQTPAQYYKETGAMARDLRKHRIRSLEDLLGVSFLSYGSE